MKKQKKVKNTMRNTMQHIFIIIIFSMILIHSIIAFNNKDNDIKVNDVKYLVQHAYNREIIIPDDVNIFELEGDDTYLPGYDLIIPKLILWEQTDEEEQPDDEEIINHIKKNIYEDEIKSEKIKEEINKGNNEKEIKYKISKENQHEENNEKKINKDEIKNVIIILDEPDNIWPQTKSYDDKQKEHVKKVMREYVIEDLQNEISINHEYKKINGFSATINQENYDDLISNPLISSIEEDINFFISLDTSRHIIGVNDSEYYYVNNKQLTGQSQSVCIIDTGINFYHEAFGGAWGNKIIAGHQFLNTAIDCNEDNDACFDVNGHGTHIAGIIAANGQVRGIAPDTNLIIMKSLDDLGKGSMSDIIQAIDWCVENKEKYNISVITMSFSSAAIYDDYCDSQQNLNALSIAINSAVNEGIFVVSATGNNASKTSISAPACLANVIRVSSANKQDAVSTFSNTWNKDLLLAPGEQILSSRFNEYQSMSGTSMAAPHVSGSIIIIKEYLKAHNIHLTNQEMFLLLNETGKNIIRNNQEFKRINVDDALNQLTSLDLNIISPINLDYESNDVLINLTYREPNKPKFNFENEVLTYFEPVVLSFKSGNQEMSIWVENNKGDVKRKNVKFSTPELEPEPEPTIPNATPIINIISPINKSYNLYEQEVKINVVHEEEIARTWINYNGQNTTYTQPKIMKFDEGENSLTVWSEDIYGNVGVNNINFQITTTPITINEVEYNNTIYLNETFYFEVELIHDNYVKEIKINNQVIAQNKSEENYTFNINTTNIGCANNTCAIMILVKDANNHEDSYSFNLQILEPLPMDPDPIPDPEPTDPDPEPINPDPEPTDPDPEPINPDSEPTDPDPEPTEPNETETNPTPNDEDDDENDNNTSNTNNTTNTNNSANTNQNTNVNENTLPQNNQAITFGTAQIPIEETEENNYNYTTYDSETTPYENYNSNLELLRRITMNQNEDQKPIASENKSIDDNEADAQNTREFSPVYLLITSVAFLLTILGFTYMKRIK